MTAIETATNGVRLGLALAAGGLALAGCAPTAPDPRGVARDETLVQTQGRGRAETKPDEARFSVGVGTFGATGPEAGAANARRMAAVVAALRQAGVAQDDLQTRQLTIARLDYGPNRGRFEANNVVAARVRDVTKASAALAAATGAGANVLSGPELRVADPEAATRSAYAAAYRAARARADAYAAAAGLKVTRVLAIRDGAAGDGPQPYPMVQTMAVAPPPVAAPPVLTGTSEAEVTVTAEFALGR